MSLTCASIIATTIIRHSHASISTRAPRYTNEENSQILTVIIVSVYITIVTQISTTPVASVVPKESKVK